MIDVSDDEQQRIVDFWFEAGYLKNAPHSGMLRIGIQQPDRTGAHVYRSIAIAYLLARLEHADPLEAAAISAIHELPEIRGGDLDKIMETSLFPEPGSKKAAELRIVHALLAQLPQEVAQAMHRRYDGFEYDATAEHQIAKDADYLERLFTGKEYFDLGFAGARMWCENSERLLVTQSAKRIAHEANEMSAILARTMGAATSLKDIPSIVGYFYRLGTLKEQMRAHWPDGLRYPDTVATHSYRSAIIAYTLACIEERDPRAAALSAAYPAKHGWIIGVEDMHSWGQRVNGHALEARALENVVQATEYLSQTPPEMHDDLRSIRHQDLLRLESPLARQLAQRAMATDPSAFIARLAAPALVNR